MLLSIMCNVIIYTSATTDGSIDYKPVLMEFPFGIAWTDCVVVK